MKRPDAAILSPAQLWIFEVRMNRLPLDSSLSISQLA